MPVVAKSPLQSVTQQVPLWYYAELFIHTITDPSTIDTATGMMWDMHAPAAGLPPIIHHT